jgi:phosphotransferase system  glucose/maltose/N-acetylglucosamine-specific IIC component
MLHRLLIRISLVFVLIIAILAAAGVTLMFGALHADCGVCVLLVLYVLFELVLAMRRLERWIGA